MTVFAEYANYYDVLYPDDKFTEEAAFADGLLRPGPGRGLSILDLGCGTGRHAEALARHGHSVVGVDRSAGMLALARKRNRDTGARFVESSIQSLEMDRTFDAATSFFHVMSYMTDTENLDLAFAAARRHLRPGGRFLFDFWFAPGVRALGAERRERAYELESGRLLRTVVPRIMAENRIDVGIAMRLFGGDGRLIDEFHENHAMKAWDVGEVEAALKRNGLVPVRFGKWLTGEAPDNGTWGAYALARRA